MKSTLSILAAMLCLVLGFALGCNSLGQSGKPGYRGSVPSPTAQAVLRDLRGQSWTDPLGTFDGGSYEVGPFAVIPNEVSPKGKGPVLRLDQGEKSVFLPLETDGDVADFFFKVTRRVAPGLSGDMSSTYRAIWRR